MIKKASIALVVTMFMTLVCTHKASAQLVKVSVGVNGGALMTQMATDPAPSNPMYINGYGGAFALRSVEPRVLNFFKKYRPRFARGQIIYSRYPKNVSAFRRFTLRHMLTNAISRPDFFTVDYPLIKEPAFIMATCLFRSKGFVRGVKNSKQYLACRRHSLYTIFENIRPQ
jgi:hypothetical protein